MSDKDLSEKAANEQLMACPFCGGKARVSEHVMPVTRFLDFGRRRITSEFKYGITCQECGAMSSQYYETMGEAVYAWNTREGKFPVMLKRTGVTVEDIDSILPAPLPMSAVEFLKIIENLNYYDHDAYQRYAWKKIQHDYAGAVAIVEAWAEEHPEERSKE